MDNYLVNLSRLPQAKVDPSVAGREIAAVGAHLAGLGESACGEFHARAVAVAIGTGTDGFNANPMAALRIIAQQRWRPTQVRNQQVEPAIVVEIRDCSSTRYEVQLERCACLFSNLLEFSIVQVVKEQIAFSVAHAERVLINLRIYMAVGQKAIRPAIIIEIKKL